jgi:hypothetical protein
MLNNAENIVPIACHIFIFLRYYSGFGILFILMKASFSDLGFLMVTDSRLPLPSSPATSPHLF